MPVLNKQIGDMKLVPRLDQFKELEKLIKQYDVHLDKAKAETENVRQLVYMTKREQKKKFEEDLLNEIKSVSIKFQAQIDELHEKLRQRPARSFLPPEPGSATSTTKSGGRRVMSRDPQVRKNRAERMNKALALPLQNMV